MAFSFQNASVYAEKRKKVPGNQKNQFPALLRTKSREISGVMCYNKTTAEREALI